MVGVAPHLRRQIERDRKTGLSVGKEVAIAAIGLLGVAEAGVLAHRPKASAIHRRLHAARERILARKAEVVDEIESVEVLRIVFALDLDTGVGPKAIAPLRAAFEGG